MLENGVNKKRRRNPFRLISKRFRNFSRKREPKEIDLSLYILFLKIMLG